MNGSLQLIEVRVCATKANSEKPQWTF